MVNLNGHEAGNGGHSQGPPTARRAFLYSDTLDGFRTKRLPHSDLLPLRREGQRRLSRFCPDHGQTGSNPPELADCSQYAARSGTLTQRGFQNSFLCTAITDASSINAAAHKLPSMPGQGRCFERRKVFLSIEKSPVTSRQTLKRRSQLSNSIAPRRTAPKASAGAVYSPETNDETNTAIAK